MKLISPQTFCDIGIELERFAAQLGNPLGGRRDVKVLSSTESSIGKLLNKDAWSQR